MAAIDARIQILGNTYSDAIRRFDELWAAEPDSSSSTPAGCVSTGGTQPEGVAGRPLPCCPGCPNPGIQLHRIDHGHVPGRGSTAARAESRHLYLANQPSEGEARGNVRVGVARRAHRRGPVTGDRSDRGYRRSVHGAAGFTAGGVVGSVRKESARPGSGEQRWSVVVAERGECCRALPGAADHKDRRRRRDAVHGGVECAFRHSR